MSIHEQVMAYVQSRLSQQDHEAFEAAMSHDENLRAEVAAMVAVRDVLGQETTNVGDDLPADGWQRLLNQIDQEEKHTPAGTPANDNRFWSMSLLQVAAVALLSILGWQTLQSAAPYVLGRGYETASAGSSEPMLQVFFSDTATFGDVSALLFDLDGWIVEGPSAIGLYLVAFQDADARDNAFSALRAQNDLIEDVLRH